MPYKSKSQVRKFFAMEDRGELPEGTARRWAHHTSSIKSLPEHVSKKGEYLGKLIVLVKDAMANAYANGNFSAGRGLAKLASLLGQKEPLVKAAAAVVGPDNALKMARFLIHKLHVKIASRTKRANPMPNQMGQIGQVPQTGQSSILPLLIALGVFGGGGALINAGLQPKRPGRAMVEGAGAGLGGLMGMGPGAFAGGVGGGMAGAGLGQMMGGEQGAGYGGLAGLLAGGLSGAGLGALGGGYLGHTAGRGLNALTGEQREPQIDPSMML